LARRLGQKSALRAGRKRARVAIELQKRNRKEQRQPKFGFDLDRRFQGLVDEELNQKGQANRTADAIKQE
jgi:hypothetical protein